MTYRLERWLELTHIRAEQIEDIVAAYRAGPLKAEPVASGLNKFRHNLGCLWHILLMLTGLFFFWNYYCGLRVRRSYQKTVRDMRDQETKSQTSISKPDDN